MERKISKTRKPWIYQEHLFRPETITKLEFGTVYLVKSSIKRKSSTRLRPRAQRAGKVKVLVKDGVRVEG